MANESLSDLASACIRCGFCLESCPTFLLSGNEAHSPRGRIYLARAAESGEIPWLELQEPLGTCLGCRACETACPSGVEYGALLELAREHLAQEHPNRWHRMLLDVTSSPKNLRRHLAFLGLLPIKRIPGVVSNWLSGESAEAELPHAEPLANWPPLDEASLPPIASEACLLEGCAMRVLFPNVHVATRRLLRRIGVKVICWDSGCCGALHAHGGYRKDGVDMAHMLAKSLPAGVPLVINSAGCGSHLKDCGVESAIDLSEFLVQHIGRLQSAFEMRGNEPELRHSSRWKVAYHDACHLAHGQKIRTQPRELLALIPGIEVVPLQESDMCCGSAGTYNVTQPKIARKLLERKWSQITASGCNVVALANPGCHAWIAQAAREHNSPVIVRHIAEILEAALSGKEL